MSPRRESREDGAVLVLIALWLPLMAIFASLALDAAHFWDFSRNLQNRVDAAVLAAGGEYGGACFGTPTQGALDNIGHTAQQYSGVPTGALDANLPYTYASATPYQNTIDAPKADAQKFHLVLNGATSADHGGTSFSNGNFCAATYDGTTAPAVDAWATQEQVPLFFKMFGFTPNISAHARVQLQGAGSTNSIPIAVPDPAQTPCLRAEVINDTTGALVTAANGTAIDVAMTPPNPTGTPPQNFWTATLPAMNVPAAQLSVQAYVPDDCNNPGYPSGGTLYDSETTPAHGIAFINTYNTYTLPVAAPSIGTVWLTPGGCTNATESAAQDAYFYFFPNSTTCTVVVHAQADFQPGASPSPRFWVRMDNGNANADTQMTADTPATDGAGRHFWKASFQIPTQSGRHTFQILWSTANGGNPTKTDFNGGNPLQATYSAFSDGSVPPDDSGPITQALIGDNTGATAGINSIQRGTSKTLTVAYRLQGISLSGPNDPPIILRTSVNNRKATGAFDCGQGTGASALHDAIVNGCPDPVSIYNPTQGCVFLPTTPLTCANLVPGNRRNQVDQAFQDRVKSAVFNGQPSPCNMWQTFKTGTPISGFEPWNPSVPDSRIIVMVVTQPGDLSGNGGPTSSVKILGFAAFYITGFDNDPWLPNKNGNGGSKIPNCTAPTNADEPYPGTGNPNNQIWGHFIKYVAAGNSSGQPCNVNDVSVCVPALTR
jgi:hypothetical protein